MQNKEYERMFAAEESLWWFRALHLFLRRFLPSDQRSRQNLLVLDIGCGTGGLVQQWVAAGYHSVGLDVSSLALSFAKHRSHHDLVRGSADNLPFRAAFDLVTCVDLLEVGSVDPQTVVTRALRALKPGGYGLFVMAAHQWLLSEHDRAVNSVRRYTQHQMVNLFSQQGVKLIRATYLFFFLFPLVALRKLINPPSQLKKVADSDVRVPSLIINEPLFALCWLEAQFLPFLSWPIGSSVLVLVRKNG